jgi:hypothetical protein
MPRFSITEKGVSSPKTGCAVQNYSAGLGTLIERTSPASFDATWPQSITIGEHAVDVNDLADFAKMRTIKLMTDIDAGDRASVHEWMRLCTVDRDTAMRMMIDGDIAAKADDSASLVHLRPGHRALVIFDGMSRLVARIRRADHDPATRTKGQAARASHAQRRGRVYREVFPSAPK